MIKADVSGKRRYLPLIALILGGIAIGCSPIFVRLSEVDAVSTAFWRLALAIVPLALIHTWNAPQTAARPRQWADILICALPGVVLAAELITWHLSLEMTSVANSTLLVNMAPVFVTGLSWLFLGKSASRRFLSGLILAIVGVVILKGGFDGFSGGSAHGDAVALLAALLYAIYFLLIGRARERFSTSTVMLWSTTSAAICTLFFAGLTEPNLLPYTAIGWALLIALSWISQLGGQGLVTYALAWLPVTFSSLTLLLQPVVAGVLAWIVLNEPLGFDQAIGGLTILAGILIARRG